MADPITRQQKRAAARRVAKGQPEPVRQTSAQYRMPTTKAGRAKARQALAMLAALGVSHG